MSEQKHLEQLIMDGNSMLRPELWDRVLNRYDLTRRERSIVLAALSERSPMRIAEAESRSVKTISGQLAAAYEKMGVTSRYGMCAKLMSDYISMMHPEDMPSNGQI